MKQLGTGHFYSLQPGFVITWLICALKWPICPKNLFVITKCSLTTEFVITKFHCICKRCCWTILTKNGDGKKECWRFEDCCILAVVSQTCTHKQGEFRLGFPEFVELKTRSFLSSVAESLSSKFIECVTTKNKSYLNSVSRRNCMKNNIVLIICPFFRNLKTSFFSVKRKKDL